MALNSIVETLREIWHLWSIRGCIIFSLSLQIFLFFFSPLRRKTGSTVVFFLIWLAYLLADWIPTFTTGLILKSLSTGTGSSVNPATGPPGIDEYDDLLALWAVSLLSHLGGSFTITAFALEDNELWFRHLIVMFVQCGTACYIFGCTLPHNKLIIPTVFSLLGGFLVNVVRVHSMHLASLDKYREDLVTGPDSPNSADTTCLKKLYKKDPSEPLHRLDVLEVAHHYFKIFKGLVVNLKRQPREQEQIKEVFCKRISSEEAYQIISCELGYMYEVFYTNRTTLPGKFSTFCRAISFLVSTPLALTYLHHAEKHGFHRADVRISYALVTAPYVQCLMLPYVLFYREKSLAIIPQKMKNLIESSSCQKISFSMFIRSLHAINLRIQYICKSISLKESQIKIKPGIMHKIDSTPLIFREWSESICSHNLISYCLKEQPRVISRPYRPLVARICKITHVAFQAIARVLLFPGKLVVTVFRLVLDLLGLKLDILDRAMYVSRGPFDKDLWNFIFTNLQSASSNNEARKLISAARGGWALQNYNHFTTRLHYIEDVEYDERLLLWHIATELCYNAEDEGDLSCSVNAEDNGDLSCSANAEDNGDLSCSANAEDNGDLPDRKIIDNREFNKMLSDYMLYLLVFQPGMMSTISGIFLKRYRVSCEQISRFHLKIRLGGEDGRLKEACRSILDQISRLPHEIHLGGEDGRLKEACRSILHRREEFPKPDSEKDGAKTIVFRACALTEELKNLPKGERWWLLSRVWLEMLVYAARNCRGDIHARSLCRGGELLTLVWLLMAHFGLIDAIVSREEKSSEQSV